MQLLLELDRSVPVDDGGALRRQRLAARLQPHSIVQVVDGPQVVALLGACSRPPLICL